MASFLTSTPTKTAISEIAEKSFRAKSDLARAEQSKPWLIFNVAVMATIALDLATGHFLLRFLIPNSCINMTIIAEKTFLVLFALNSLFLIFLSLKPFLWPAAPICLTSRQMKLLGVSEKTPLFKKHRPDKTVPSKDSSTFDLSWLYHVKNPSYSTNGVSSLTDSTFPDDQSYSPSFLGASAIGGPSPGRPGGPRETYAESLLRLRRARSCSPFVSSASTISNSKQLRQYLKKTRKMDFLTYKTENESLDHRQASFRERSSFDEDFFESGALSNSTELAALPRSFLQPPQQNLTALPPKIDFSALAGQKYHVSPVVSVEDSVGVAAMGEQPESALPGGLNASVISPAELTVWLKFDIDPSKLDLLTHNARIWISKTIFKPISAEIDSLNNKLSAYSPLTAIGSTNLSSLRHLILTQSDHFQGQNQFSSNLSSLLPYLELSVDQAYLVSRIKALARGTCLGEYAPFSTRYGVDINDFDIVLHFLRVYLTSRLASNPLKIDDHFSTTGPSRFFVLYPSKLPAPATSAGSSFPLHQQKLSSGHKKSLFIYRPGPEPRVQIVYGGQILDVGGKGTNNLFRAFVLFVQILHLDFDSRLISLSLGPSGLNLLWILD